MSVEHDPSLAELAARVLRRAERDVPADRDRERDRDTHVALLAATLRDERARRSRQRWAGATLAAAAVVAAAFGLRSILREPGPSSAPQAAGPSAYDMRVEGSGATIARSDAASGSPSPEEMHAGDRVIAQNGRVTVAVATGTKIALEQGSELAVVEEGRTQIFALGMGSLGADVAELRAGERFLVRTADTEIEVRGTSFRVERVDAVSSCRPDLHTRVVVSKGVVVVRHADAEDRVGANEQWPPACASVPPVSPVPAESHEAAPPAPPSTSTAHAPPPPRSAAPPPSAPVSKLAAANELFARGESASKSGDPRGAVVLFDRLLAEHPTTAIAESARVERMRALDKFDRPRAVAAARDYLARFPRGFARAEAQALIALGP